MGTVYIFCRRLPERPAAKIYTVPVSRGGPGRVQSDRQVACTGKTYSRHPSHLYVNRPPLSHRPAERIGEAEPAGEGLAVGGAFEGDFRADDPGVGAEAGEGAVDEVDRVEAFARGGPTGDERPLVLAGAGAVDDDEVVLGHPVERGAVPGELGAVEGIGDGDDGRGHFGLRRGGRVRGGRGRGGDGYQEHWDLRCGGLYTGGKGTALVSLRRGCAWR